MELEDSRGSWRVADSQESKDRDGEGEGAPERWLRQQAEQACGSEFRSISSTHVKSHATCNRSAGVQRREDAWALLAS